MQHVKLRFRPNQEVTLCPLGDIQWAGDESDLAYEHLKEHISICMKSPTPRFIGMGDYIDFASPSNRQRLADAKLYDTAKKVIAAAGKGLVEELVARVLKPTIGKWIGLTEGHHHHPVILGKKKDGTETVVDSDVYLSKLLDTRYLEEFALVEMEWVGQGKFGVVAFHGTGSSTYPWGPLTRLWRLVPNFSADLLLMGHQTKKTFAETNRVSMDGSAHRVIKIVGTGGWTKGYVPGKRTYISEAAMTPVALGQPIIHIRPKMRGRIWDPNWTVEG